MQSEITKLLQLQELDAETLKTRKELERYPALRKARRDEVAALSKKLDEAKHNRVELEKRIHESEVNVAKWREDLVRFAAQQERVKSQKEYDALSHEIGETGQRISAEDEKGLEFVTEEERLDTEIAQLQKHLEERNAECEKEMARLDEREKEKAAYLDSLAQQRDKAVAKIAEDFLKRYERLAGVYPGNALVPVQEGNCGGCNMRVLARTLQDVQRSDSLVECTSCHRFLYITGS
jgi:uncharacterized protein